MVRSFVVATLLLFGAAQAEAQELVVEGTIDFVAGGGPDLSSQVGKTVRAWVVYDPTVPQNSSTLGDPGTGFFDDATLCMRIQLPDAGIDVVFEPEFDAMAIVINDGGVPGVAETDQLTFGADGPTQPAPVQGDFILTGEVQLSESTVMSASPDLVTTADSLPLTPLDLDTPGIVSLQVGFGYESFNVVVLNATNFTPVDPAQDPLLCPEPRSALALGAAIAAVAGLGAARSRLR